MGKKKNECFFIEFEGSRTIRSDTLHCRVPKDTVSNDYCQLLAIFFPPERKKRKKKTVYER